MCLLKFIIKESYYILLLYVAVGTNVRAGALVTMETPRRLRDWECPKRVSTVQSGLMVCQLIDGPIAAVDNDDGPP